MRLSKTSTLFAVETSLFLQQRKLNSIAYIELLSQPPIVYQTYHHPLTLPSSLCYDNNIESVFFVGIMSTPQGPRDSGTNRGRGRTRGTFRTRGGRNEVIEDQQSNRRAPQLTRGSDWPPRQTRNAPPKQNEGRSSKLRPKEAGPSPRPRNHSQKPSRTSPAPPMKPQDASWRNPVEEPTGSYQKHMSDLYQTVCVSTS